MCRWLQGKQVRRITRKVIRQTVDRIFWQKSGAEEGGQAGPDHPAGAGNRKTSIRPKLHVRFSRVTKAQQARNPGIRRTDEKSKDDRTVNMRSTANRSSGIKSAA
jgi:hypothetical protein